MKSQLQTNTKRMKASVAISQANVAGLKSKDDEITQLQKEIYQLKMDYFKEVSEFT